MKKIKINTDEYKIVPLNEGLLKDNGNNSNYITDWDVTKSQWMIIENMINQNKILKPSFIKINGKYIGHYGKCGAWHYVFGWKNNKTLVLTHDWGGYEEEVYFKELKNWYK